MISSQFLITITAAVLSAIGFLMAVCNPSSNLDLTGDDRANPGHSPRELPRQSGPQGAETIQL